MPRDWTLNFELDTVSKLMGNNAHAQLHDEEDVSRVLLALDFVQDESSHWDVSGQQRVFVKWHRYKVRANLEEADEARVLARGAELRSRIASRLAFMTGGPVRVQKGFSISEVVPEGEPYSLHSADAEYGIGGGEWEPPVPRLDWALQHMVSPAFEPWLLPSAPFDRALLWLQTSFEATTPFSEFANLMTALEALAPLLGGPKDQYWECSSCHRVFTDCPNCGASTARASSANAILRSYTTSELKWKKADWDRVYDLRSRFLHGDKAPTGQDLLDIAPLLPRIERVLLTGLKSVLGRDPTRPPFPRPRAPFLDPSLHLRLRPPGPPGDSAPNPEEQQRGLPTEPPAE